MRLAVCISGFLRTFEETKSSLKAFIDRCGAINVDLFVVTFHQNYQHFTNQQTDEYNTEAEIKELLSEFNVVKLVVQDRETLFPQIQSDVDSIYQKYPHINSNNYEHFTPDSKHGLCRLAYRLYDQLYNIELCDKLRCEYEMEQGFKYDWVMRTRFDVLYFDATPNLLNTLKPNCIYVGYGAFNPSLIGRHFPDEIVAIGDRLTMEKYSQRLEAVRDGKVMICAHMSLKHVLDSNPQIGYQTNTFKYCVLRSPEQVHYLGQVISIEDLQTQSR